MTSVLHLDLLGAVDTSSIGFFDLARRLKTELRLPVISSDGSNWSNGRVLFGTYGRSWSGRFNRIVRHSAAERNVSVKRCRGPNDAVRANHGSLDPDNDRVSDASTTPRALVRPHGEAFVRARDARGTMGRSTSWGPALTEELPCALKNGLTAAPRWPRT
jgi:hypothetical protein